MTPRCPVNVSANRGAQFYLFLPEVSPKEVICFCLTESWIFFPQSLYFAQSSRISMTFVKPP